MNEQMERSLDRRECTARLLKSCPEALVISGLGSPSYDVFAAGDRAENFYLWGAMGGAAAMGLGLALAQPRRQVLVITGDGEMLMGLGALATIGAQQPDNLSIVVLDNGHYGETGMQRSHTAQGTSLSGVASACGIRNVCEVRALEDIDAVAARVRGMNGCTFATVPIRAEELRRVLPPRDGVYTKNRFRLALGMAPV